MAICSTDSPPPLPVAEAHVASCWLHDSAVTAAQQTVGAPWAESR
jgi:hypothetical protein